MLALIPPILKAKGDLSKVKEDLQEVFTTSIKKSIVDFVLGDPSNQYSLATDVNTPERQELAAESTSWGLVLKRNKKMLAQKLFITHPSLRQMIDRWINIYQYVSARKIMHVF